MFGFGIGDIVGAANTVFGNTRGGGGNGVSAQDTVDNLLQNHEDSEWIKDTQHEINGKSTVNEWARTTCENNLNAITTNSVTAQQDTIGMVQDSAKKNSEHISSLGQI